MTHLCKSSDKGVVELSEDVLMEILHRLPSKSLSRFVCVCKHWWKYIADPSLDYSCRSKRWSPRPFMMGFFCQGRNIKCPFRTEGWDIPFFFSRGKSSEVIDGSIEKSVNVLGREWYIIASSNGFILIAGRVENPRHYYVYNPATKQYRDIPLTQASCMLIAAIGFHCKVDDPEKDVVSFSIVRYERWVELRSSVTIESFSSETNLWTTIDLRLDVPLQVTLFGWQKLASAGVIDGVFCWIDAKPEIFCYDSVNRRFWALGITEWMAYGYPRGLGVSGGILYYALWREAGITVWCLESNIRSQDAVWVRKYAVNIRNALLNCLEAFGLAHISLEVTNMEIHPVNSHILYLLVADNVVISYDFEKNIAQLLPDKEVLNRLSISDSLRYARQVRRNKEIASVLLFSYEWHQWPRLL